MLQSERERADVKAYRETVLSKEQRARLDASWKLLEPASMASLLGLLEEKWSRLGECGNYTPLVNLLRLTPEQVGQLLRGRTENSRRAESVRIETARMVLDEVQRKQMLEMEKQLQVLSEAVKRGLDRYPWEWPGYNNDCGN